MTTLESVLSSAYAGQERLSRDELLRRALAADVAPYDMARLDVLPEGEYAEDEALEALRQVPELVPEMGEDPL